VKIAHHLVFIELFTVDGCLLQFQNLQQ